MNPCILSNIKQENNVGSGHHRSTVLLRNANKRHFGFITLWSVYCGSSHSPDLVMFYMHKAVLASAIPTLLPYTQILVVIFILCIPSICIPASSLGALVTDLKSCCSRSAILKVFHSDLFKEILFIVRDQPRGCSLLASSNFTFAAVPGADSGSILKLYRTPSCWINSPSCWISI